MVVFVLLIDIIDKMLPFCPFTIFSRRIDFLSLLCYNGEKLGREIYMLC